MKQLATKKQRTLVQRAFRHHARDVGQRVVRGAAITFLGMITRIGVTIGSTAVLARLLAPSDFGHLAMATVVTEFAALFANFGFGSVLIQRSRSSRLQFDTTFWASLALGAVLAIMVLGFSFHSDILFDDPLVGDLLRVLCWLFLFDALVVVPYSLLMRLLMFRELFFIQVTMLICRAGTAMAFAVIGLGVWSLVAGAIAGALGQFLAYYIVTRYIPRLRFDRRFLASTWRTNGSYFGNGVLFFINTNIDLIIIGRTLGAQSLGYYQNARSLTDEIRARIAMPLQQVLFPAFASMAADMERIRDGVLRSGRLVSLIVISVGVGIAAVSEDLVTVLYGDKWLPMVPALQIISVAAAIRAASTIATPIFNALDRVALSFGLNLASTVLFAGFVVLGSPWGLVGISVGVFGGALLGLVTLRVGVGLIGLDSFDLLRVLAPPLVASGIMAAAVTVFRESAFMATTALPMRLTLEVGIGAVTYVAASALISRRHVADLRTAIARFRRR